MNGHGDPATWLIPWSEEGHGWESLAKYASPLCLPPSLRLKGSSIAAQEDLESVLVQLARMGIWYANPPWWAGQGQLVRDPDTILQGGVATCLDVVLLTAAMLLLQGEHTTDRQSYPLIAVGTKRDGRSRHAFVLNSERRILRSAHERRGVADCSDLTKAVVCDPTSVLRASGSESRTSEAALAAGRSLLDPRSTPFGYVDLIDVRWAHREHVPLGPPVDRPESLYEMLPSARGTERARDQWQQDLAWAPGLTVVAGPSGVGKTFAALSLIDSAPSRSGWFLEGTNPSVLRRSFAAAEVRSSPRLASVANGERSQLLASNALARLSRLSQPWTVILDGLDGDPQEYQDLLPPANEEWCQAVVVTSVDPRWIDWAKQRKARFVEVPADALSQLLIGMNAPADATPQTAVESAISRLTPSAATVACTLAWLPPSNFWAGRLPDDAGPSDEDLNALTDAGLLDATTGVMHRQVQAILRSDFTQLVDFELLLAVIAKRRAEIRGFSDSTYYRQLFDLLGKAAPRTSIIGRSHLRDVIARDELALAKEMAEHLLEQIGWSADGRDDMPQWEREVVAGCLESCARPLIRRKTTETRAQGIVLAQTAVHLTSDRDLKSRLTALALVGHRGLAGKDPNKLREVLLGFEQVLSEREESLTPGDPDIDKALFNLAGTRRRLGSVVDEPEKSGALRRALAEYREVLEARARYLGDAMVDDVAACHNGIGLTQYQLAAEATVISGRAPSRLDRIATLASATESLAKAARIRVLWFSSYPDAMKQTVHVLVKVAALQSLLVGAAPAAEKIEEMLSEVLVDLQGE